MFLAFGFACHPSPELESDGVTKEETTSETTSGSVPTEICGEFEVPYDGVDNDCDPSTPDDDLDGDGLVGADDCDDSDPSTGGPEVYADRIDNDCDGLVDCDDPDLDPNPITLDDVDQWGNIAVSDVVAACRTSCEVSADGIVFIDHWQGSDLTPLSCLTAVTSLLEVFGCPNLVSLEGLHRVRTAGTVGIDANPKLEDASMAGLESTYQVALASGPIHTADFPNLTQSSSINLFEVQLADASGFGQISTPLDALTVTSNPEFSSFTGLEGVSRVTEMTVRDLDGLVDLDGLQGVTSAGAVTIANNDSLVSLYGLSALETVSCDSCWNPELSILNNPTLASLDDLSALTSIEGDLKIKGNLTLGDAAAQAWADGVAVTGSVVIDN